MRRTVKLYVDGKYIRSESGHVFNAKSKNTKAVPFNLCESSRKDLRNHFEISAKFIVLSALQLLRNEGAVSAKEIKDFIKAQDIDLNKKNLKSGYT